MKIVSKLKKVIVGIGVGIITFENKVFALSPNMIIEPEMIKAETAYGIPRPSPIRMILKVTKTFIIPLAVIIGLIIYFKKSKSSKKKKILVTIGIIAITVILYFVVNKIIYELA